MGAPPAPLPTMMTSKLSIKTGLSPQVSGCANSAVVRVGAERFFQRRRPVEQSLIVGVGVLVCEVSPACRANVAGVSWMREGRCDGMAPEQVEEKCGIAVLVKVPARDRLCACHLIVELDEILG